MRANEVHGAVAAIAERFAAERGERQARTALDPDDFAALADAGLQRAAVPAARGGLWESAPASARTFCELHRTLAHGDPSVALVAAMHPAVLSYWWTTPDAPEPHAGAWREQLDAIALSIQAGAWWGTITSEPGSGGDVGRTRATAQRDGDGWLLSGQKHFGSGTGVSAYMITTARPDGEPSPDWFYVHLQGAALDGSGGVRLVAPWDGHGMRATQSHGLAFERYPATRMAWPGQLDEISRRAAPFAMLLFTAVVLGIVETAIETARAQLAPRAEALRPYEQVEWANAELEAWMAEQAYEGGLRALESGEPARGAALRAKTAVAQLAESSLQRLCRVLGGGTFARRSPFGHWYEDVRALGFLRPPWGLAYDGLIADTWAPTTGGT